MEPGPLVHEAGRGLHHPRLPEQHLLLVHGPDQRFLVPIDRRVAIAAGALHRVGSEGIGLRADLVAGHQAGVPVRARVLQPHFPVRRIRAEEEDVRAGVARAFHRVAFPAVPVLVVADAEEPALPAQRGHAFARDGEVRRVAHVVSGALEEAGHVGLVAEDVAGAVVVDVRAIEADLDREAAGKAELVVVERLAHPAVVGLVRGDAGLEVEVAHAVVLDHQRDVSAVGERLVPQDADEIEPADGALRDLHREGRRPVALDQPCGRVGRAGGLRPGGRGPLRQLARASAAVPTQPVERPVDAHRAAHPRRDVRHHLDVLARLRGDPIRIRFDVHRTLGGARAGGRAVATGEGPPRVAGERVLRRDRIHVSRWTVLWIRSARSRDHGVAGSAFRASEQRTRRHRQAPVPHGRKLGARSSARNPARRRSGVYRRTCLASGNHTRLTYFIRLA